MIWHIFRKDWKLLWKFVVGLGALHVFFATMLYQLDHGAEHHALASFMELFAMSSLFGSAILIAAAVHLDSIPGVRQDWLVRPVRRFDLLAAKFLFAVLLVQMPVFLADLFAALASGFSFGEALKGAAARGLFWLLALVVPSLAFGSVTRNLTECVLGGLAVFIVGAGFKSLAWPLMPGGIADPTINTGIGWLTEDLRLAVALSAGAAILGMQFFRRMTLVSRVATGAGVLALLCTTILPFRPVFAVEEKLSPQPGAASAVTLRFDPAVSRFHDPSGLPPAFGHNNLVRREEGDMQLHIPLRITGLGDDTVLHTDYSEARAVTPDGRVTQLALGEDFNVRVEGKSSGSQETHQGIRVRGPIFQRFKDRPVKLEIEYSLTLLHLAESHAMPALNGSARFPGLARCETKMNDAGTAMNLRCMQPAKVPSCATFFLEHTPSGRRNPARFGCPADYAPFSGRYVPDGMRRFGVPLPFRDSSGLAKYPVDGPQLPESQVVMRIYTPVEHFSRTVVVEAVRLGEWVAE